MAVPKDKKGVQRAPKREKTEKFDPFWTNKSGTVDSEADYIHAACREPKGFHRGARIR